MALDEDEQDKPHDATEKKLLDARKKGDFARSTDLNTTLLYGGLIFALIFLSGSVAYNLGEYLSHFLSSPENIRIGIFYDNAFHSYTEMLWRLGLIMLPFFGALALGVVVSIVAQRGFVFAPSKLAFKASRISVVENIKNKFGPNGLFEFLKSTVKLVLYSLVLSLMLYSLRDEIVATVFLSPHQSVLSWLTHGIRLLGWALLVSVAIASVDFLWKRYEFLRRQRMSHKELKDEMKESEGDPHLKSARRSKAHEIAFNKMMLEVPESDVVVVNPTHYAVVLKWQREMMGAPVCVAKGRDNVAARIREVAQSSGVPIFRDPPTARTLFAEVDVGQEVQPHHYREVAAAIRFAEELKTKKNKVYGR